VVVFERFTRDARKVVVLAQEEAQSFNHNYVGTEHLLLGLIREEDGTAARALNYLGVGLDAAREQVESIVGYGEEGTGGQAPFTPRSKKVLELALREALQLGHNYIGTEHILLGLVEEREGVAVRVLTGLDVSPDDVRREVLRSFSESDRGEWPGPIAGAERAPAAIYSRALAAFPDTMLRVRVEGMEVRVGYGATEEERSRPRRLLVDLDCSYDEARRPEGVGTLNPEAVLGGVAGVLGGRPIPSLPEAVKRVGGYVLETFPEVTDAAVTITDTYEHREDVAVSGVSVTRAFSRSFRA
jgi:dihydroneopterin aldolase